MAGTYYMGAVRAENGSWDTVTRAYASRQRAERDLAAFCERKGFWLPSAAVRTVDDLDLMPSWAE